MVYEMSHNDVLMSYFFFYKMILVFDVPNKTISQMDIS